MVASGSSAMRTQGRTMDVPTLALNSQTGALRPLHCLLTCACISYCINAEYGVVCTMLPVHTRLWVQCGCIHMYIYICTCTFAFLAIEWFICCYVCPSIRLQTVRLAVCLQMCSFMHLLNSSSLITNLFLSRLLAGLFASFHL